MRAIGLARPGDRSKVFLAELLCLAIFISGLLTVPTPASAAVSGVTVTASAPTINSGNAVYAKATVAGTGDFDRRVTWSLSPGNAGTVSPTGLFISGTAFIGTATIKATSVENPKLSGTANVIVSAGSGAVHVDLNNTTGVANGTALRPYRTIQAAIDHAGAGGTIKVAQGTYIENVNLSWEFGILLLGGFKGGSTTEYAANLPGDFVSRSTDHVALVTTIQSPNRNTPVVALGVWDPSHLLIYAVDGFTLTGGSNGVRLNYRGQVEVFVSQNLINDNGVTNASNGGGILAGGGGANLIALNNRIINNRSGGGGGLHISTDAGSTFLIQGNVINTNVCGGDTGGGVVLDGSGSFTWNQVQGNRANLLSTYGYGGGVFINSGPVELNHNIYGNNEAISRGGGVIVANGVHAVLRHELIFKNKTTEETGGAGMYVFPSANVTVDHCTITGNTGSGTDGNGLFVREQATAHVSNSIIWGNSGTQLYVAPGSIFNIIYSDSQTYAGAGNISANPLFASSAADDYHLKSKRGRWNPATSQWIMDALQSPCIDTGNPASPFNLEPSPNGARTNMGVYGNTPEASKSIRDQLPAILYNLLES